LQLKGNSLRRSIGRHSLPLQQHSLPLQRHLPSWLRRQVATALAFLVAAALALDFPTAAVCDGLFHIGPRRGKFIGYIPSNTGIQHDFPPHAPHVRDEPFRARHVYVLFDAFANVLI